jgi:hypothetical protein
MGKDGKESKASRKEKEARKIAEFANRLFGDINDMSPEEVDVLHDPSDLDPEETIYGLADEIATPLRKQNKVPPPHVQAALDATRPLKDFTRVPESRLRRIIDGILNPNPGPARQLSYSFRNRTGLLKKYLEILEAAAEEVRQDWSKP